MANNTSGQKLYSPLKQYISDSDSEEEIHNSAVGGSKVVLVESYDKTNIIHGGGNKAYNQFCGRNGNIHKSSEGKNKTWKSHNRSADSHLDDGSILPGENNTHGKDMSTLRKIMFVCSIILCLLVVVIFLWVIPCGEKGECSGSVVLKNKGGNSWENSYQDMELKGTINIVNGVSGKDKNLVLMFRGDVINVAHAEGGRESSDSGIVLLVGTSGKVGWFITQPRLPTEIDCTLLDVDSDGNKDCIVVGEKGLFATLDPTIGTIFWYLHNHPGITAEQTFTSIDFPIVILDIDGDGVSDLLTACFMETQNNTIYNNDNGRNAVIFISGGTGSIIGQPLAITQCTSINKLQIDENRIISYTCKNNTTLAESLKVISLEDLYKAITNKPYKTEWAVWGVGKQHPIVGRRKEIENERNVYSIDGRKLIVENQGNCPKNCKVSVQLIDERSGKENISWQYIASQVYGMVPATLLFNNSLNNNILKHHISGFVLKFWQWNVHFKNTNRYDRNTDPNFNIFNNIERPPESKSNINNNDKNPQRKTRNIPPKQTKLNGNVTANRLTERVVLVTFNATDFHIVNASQSDIFQICLPEKGVCQPDLSHQENSLLIADIDGDGSQELVTYLTSFMCPDFNSYEELPHEDIRCNENWKLYSTVRVVRLEAELPKLYEAVSHH